jgi:glutathionylspermidine synthase
VHNVVKNLLYSPPSLQRFTTYTAFADALQRNGIISDPWVEGKERFRLTPIILPESTYTRLQRAAEELASVYEELCEVLWETPQLRQEFFRLTPYQELLWQSSGGRWHGIARLDMFLCDHERIQTCEMNSDTPSGEAEAVLLNDMLLPSSNSSDEHPSEQQTDYLVNPNAEFVQRFTAMVWQSYRAGVDAPVSTPTLGIVYPTEMPEDLAMLTLYKTWLEQAGFRVIMGSPFNLTTHPQHRVALFGVPLDVVVRHYKTDWWTERLPVWKDTEGFPDPDPLEKPLYALLAAEYAGTCAVVNPFGAVITQNKLSMAFCWQHIHRFSTAAQAAIAAYIPETWRFTDLDVHALCKDEWVLKSDYGCEGDEVLVGNFVSQEQWQQALELAVPERWIVQRFFEAQPEKPVGETPTPESPVAIPNYGVYVIGGKASGIYTRLSMQATDYRAVSAATFVRREHHDSLKHTATA